MTKTTPRLPQVKKFRPLPAVASTYRILRLITIQSAPIRVVFDSNCEFEGVSLNKVLLPGPDLMNNLIGVLMPFRRENITVICDIEQMFHSFYFDPPHRDFLRFLWFVRPMVRPSKPIIECRMNVKLFVNGPSPAVATYGLRRTAVDGEEAKKFICRA